MQHVPQGPHPHHPNLVAADEHRPRADPPEARHRGEVVLGQVVLARAVEVEEEAGAALLRRALAVVEVSGEDAAVVGAVARLATPLLLLLLAALRRPAAGVVGSATAPLALPSHVAQRHHDLYHANSGVV